MAQNRSEHDRGPAAPDLDAPIRVSGHTGGFVVRDFFTRNEIPFSYTPSEGPVEVRTSGGAHLVTPTLRELAAAAGCHMTVTNTSYDLVVVGAGPAGLAAAVYGAAESLRVLVIEAFATGGQAGTTSLIENYPGFTEGISGSDLAERTRLQAERLGAEIVLANSVVDGGTRDDGSRTVILDDGTQITAGAVVCSTGVEWRRLELPGLDELEACGVFYGAATSEAPGVRDRDIVVIGGGNSAGQAALFFARVARSVTIAVRGEALSSTLSRYLLERIEKTQNIEVLTRTQVTAVTGDNWLRTATLSHADGSDEEREVHALFVCIGGVPQTQWAAEHGVAVDAAGYLLTGADLRGEVAHAWPLERPPDALETSLPRMYATGDVRHGSTKRIATAMCEGALVVKTAHDRLTQEGLV
ncbi:MAG: FAD-dependent oxidoreductase [Ornithinimicrobium sp.]